MQLMLYLDRGIGKHGRCTDVMNDDKFEVPNLTPDGNL